MKIYNNKSYQNVTFLMLTVLLMHAIVFCSMGQIEAPRFGYLIGLQNGIGKSHLRESLPDSISNVSSSSSVSLKLGVSLDFNITNRLIFNSSPNISVLKSQLKYTNEESGIDETIATRPAIFELPFSLKYAIEQQSPFYVLMGLSMNVRISPENFDNSERSHFAPKIKSMYYDAHVGLGIGTNSKMSAEFRYTVGISNILSETNLIFDKMSSKGLSLTVIFSPQWATKKYAYNSGYISSYRNKYRSNGTRPVIKRKKVGTLFGKKITMAKRR